MKKVIGTSGDYLVIIFSLLVPSTERVWHKAILRRVLVQGIRPDMPGGSKNASGQVNIPIQRAPQIPGNKPCSSEEG